MPTDYCQRQVSDLLAFISSMRTLGLGPTTDDECLLDYYTDEMCFNTYSIIKLPMQLHGLFLQFVHRCTVYVGLA